MESIDKKKIAEKNDKIIEHVMNEIENKCKDSIDLIGICENVEAESNDIELVIVVNTEDTQKMNKSFIIGDDGFDIYTKSWADFEEMSRYNNPNVAKLIDLKILYKSDDTVMERYMTLQQKLQQNMRNNALVMLSIREQFKNVLNAYREILATKNISVAYRKVADMIKGVEHILYMANKSYIKKGIKRIPEEIAQMEILPDGFMNKYLEIVKCTTLEEIRAKAGEFIDCIEKFLDEKRKDYAENKKQNDEEELKTKDNKEEITVDDLTGTYEEIYSNWRNKAHYAAQIENVYLSFMVMAYCQEFYDEMFARYDIPEIDLIGKYNPNDLAANAYQFDKALNEWGKLYDKFNKKIEKVSSIEKLI